MEKTIQSVAEEIYKNMIQKSRDNGDKFYCLKERVQWQTDIIHDAHIDRLPDDTVYDVINDVLGAIADMDTDDGEDEAREILYGIEPPVYTSDLTKWLASHNGNVEYMTRAMSEYDLKDGFGVLSGAYCIFLQEIGNDLITAIVKYIDGLED